MVFLAVAAVLVFLLFMPVKTVLVLEGESANQAIDAEKRVFAKYEAKEGTTFAVSFIHSVNKSRVKEGYIIKDNEIYLTNCLYSGFGAGVATEVEEGQTLSYTEDGEMLISNIDRKMNGLSYIVGTVSDHVLEINGEEISLRGLCGKNSTVRFKIEKQSIVAF